jgi:hypothetical protein
MFSEDKVTEIFCMADDFCKFFDAKMKKYTLPKTSLKSNTQGTGPLITSWSIHLAQLPLIACSLKNRALFVIDISTGN